MTRKIRIFYRIETNALGMSSDKLLERDDFYLLQKVDGTDLIEFRFGTYGSGDQIYIPEYRIHRIEVEND